jgi:hypothetical protein
MTALVALGVALRLWAYAWPTSLYLDEILLTRNIFDLPLSHLLTQPLLFDQVAPRGFLLVERVLVTTLGHNELALRLFPFACAVGGLLLFRRLAERLLAEAAAMLALLLFAIAVPFLRFGADVKPYSGDVLAAVGLTLLALDLRTRDLPATRLVQYGLVGVVVVWFSQTSVLVMAGLGLGLGLDWLIRRDARAARGLAVTMPIWAGGCALALVASLHSMTAATQTYMHEFWMAGFAPWPWRSAADLRWFWDQWTSLFSDATLLRYRWPVTFTLIAIAGLVAVWKRNRSQAWLLAGPLVMATVAAAAQQYPLRGRLAVWLLPFLLISVAGGVDWLRQQVRRLHPWLAAAVVVGALVSPVIALATAPPPYEIEHHWDVLRYLQQHRRPGDAVHVLQLQQIGTRFYGPRYGLLPDDWNTSICDRSDVRAFIRDVDRYRGAKRLWLVAGSGRPFTPVHVMVRNYLSTIGVKTDSAYFTSLTSSTVGVELYDLSDPARLLTATAATFPVPTIPIDQRPGCRDWAQPEAR